LLKRDEEEVIDELEEMIQRSVQLRLMSDVPLGAFLSGGIDRRDHCCRDEKRLVCATRRPSPSRSRKARMTRVRRAARIAEHLGLNHTVESLQVSDPARPCCRSTSTNLTSRFADSSAFATMAVCGASHVAMSLLL